jgi:hypothetical protein
MTTNINYKKGGNLGGIFDNGTEGATTWTAVTAAFSKTFKTLAGAERFMSKNGYVKKQNK